LLRKNPNFIPLEGKAREEIGNLVHSAIARDNGLPHVFNHPFRFGSLLPSVGDQGRNT
jgi:hypothetical protein